MFAARPVVFARALLSVLALLAAARLAAAGEQAKLGFNFDTGVSPDKAREWLVTHAPRKAPPGSWLRLRGLDAWAVEAEGAGPDVEREARRRGDLQALREAGFRLVAVVRWSSWAHGTRPAAGAHRLPVDLRDAHARTRRLAAAYGDLIDYWEIDNEPDISFVYENPETYAAFLKACYLGIDEGRGARAEGRETSRVLMGPLALPPGPYFEAFVRNDGLRYTDGFNYHYYGHAEDFSGAYRLFDDAVARLQREQAETWPRQAAEHDAATAVWRTHFYPSAEGWRGELLATFDHPAEVATANRDALLARPLAREEPASRAAGRWLVTDGIRVEETADGWRFHLERWPAGPLRAPAAELALPAGWGAGPGSLLTFEYRALPQSETVRASSVPTMNAAPASEPGPGAEKPAEARGRARPAIDPLAPATEAAPLPVAGSARNGWRARELPVFLTEYGYGSLDKISRRSAEGRERQREFFASVTRQIADLGIEGAMAFVLMSYLERDLLEFGLLMNEESAPAETTAAAAAKRLGTEFVSPALETLSAAADLPLKPKRWRVQTPEAGAVVIDFVATKGLGMAKSFSGYFLEGQHGRAVPGEGELVLYHFGAEPVTGALQLEGEAWTLADGRRAAAVTLRPGERRVFPVRISTGERRFVASPVTAWFRPGVDLEPEAKPREPDVAATPAPRAAAAESRPEEQAVARATPLPKPGEPMHTFEPYFRAANGTLFQTWPRLVPTAEWQVYMQRAENFGPAFYGRLEQPWRFMETQPVSLVFFFHPEAFPAVIEVRRPMMVRFSAP